MVAHAENELNTSASRHPRLRPGMAFCAPIFFKIGIAKRRLQQYNNYV